MIFSIPVIIILCFTAIGIAYFFCISDRTAGDVLLDLAEGKVEEKTKAKAKKKSRPKKLSKNDLYNLEYSLPLAMEQLVMTVEAGLDVAAGMRVLVELDEQANTKDPVVAMLSDVIKYCDQGFSLSESLELVASVCPLPALKHAFIHLSLAYQQGGELVSPLRELSDATQLQYQESIEELISKLPVKATMPLALVFSGLILFFVTAPIIQVISLTSQAALG